MAEPQIGVEAPAESAVVADPAIGGPSDQTGPPTAVAPVDGEGTAAAGDSSGETDLFDGLLDQTPAFNAEQAVADLRSEFQGYGLKDFTEQTKRDLGRVGSLQRDMEALKGQGASLDLIGQQVSALVGALGPSLDPVAAQRLADLNQQGQIDAAVAARTVPQAQAEIAPESAPAPVSDQPQAAAQQVLQTRLNEAESAVVQYATARGVDLDSQIPAAEWSRVAKAVNFDPTRIETVLKAAVDKLAARQGQRQEIQTAGAQQVSAASAGAGITPEQFAEMSREEMLKVPAEELDRAAKEFTAAGGRLI